MQLVRDETSLNFVVLRISIQLFVESAVEFGERVDLFILALVIFYIVYLVVKVDPLRCSDLDAPEVAKAHTSIVILFELPVKSHREGLLFEVEPVVFGTCINQFSSFVYTLAPEVAPPVVELVANSAQLCIVDAAFEVFSCATKNSGRESAPLVSLAHTKALNGFIPLVHEVLISDHAVLKLLFHIKVERASDYTSIETGNFVALVREEVHS